ncbi:MAG: CIA30 family protein [Bacteroidota bacterium]
MKTILTILMLSVGLLSEGHKVSFKKSTDISDWKITNDGVMGGLSKGAIKTTDSGILFFGEVSLKNFGGFTSYKSAFKEYDLSQYKKVEIKYRSTGSDMAMQLETSKQFFSPYFKVNLPVSKDWIVRSIDLTKFNQYQMGESTGSKIQGRDLKRVVRIGFITNEKKEGPFQFEVEFIRFV